MPSAGRASEWPLSVEQAIRLLFPSGPPELRWSEIADQGRGGWTLTPLVDSIIVTPLELDEDRSVFARVVGCNWKQTVRVANDEKRRPHVCIFWGVLRRNAVGVLGIAELSVAPLDPDDLTLTMLRSLSVEGIVRRARVYIARADEWVDLAATMGWDAKPETARAIRTLARKARAQRGRRGNPPEFYRAFASRALELQQGLGISRGLRAELARREYVEPSTIRDWIKRSRDLGFLAEGEWGKAGLAPGPKLFEEER